MSQPDDKKDLDPENLTTVTHCSQIGEIHGLPEPTHDAVFGDMREDGPNYRSVCNRSWSFKRSLTY